MATILVQNLKVICKQIIPLISFSIVALRLLLEQTPPPSYLFRKTWSSQAPIG